MNSIMKTTTIIGIVASILTFGSVRLLTGGSLRSKILRTCAEFEGMLRKRSSESSWHQRQTAWLLKNGASYHYAKKVTPEKLLTVAVILGAAGFLTGIRAADTVIGMALGGILGALPYLLLPMLNRSDNDKMLPEIRMIYHALAMQIRAGVYVTDALAECYSSVREKRLQDALLALAGDIVMKSDLYEALDHFQRKFDNRYIDTLCITVLSAMESGQAVEMLGDIAEQVKDMEHTVMGRRKASLDRSITFYQLGMLSAVLGIALYSCVGYMLGAVGGL